MKVEFEFAPLDRVIVRAYRLDCRGRVIRCYVGFTGVCYYDVEYALNGDIRNALFMGDDLVKDTDDQR